MESRGDSSHTSRGGGWKDGWMLHWSKNKKKREGEEEEEEEKKKQGVSSLMSVAINF